METTNNSSTLYKTCRICGRELPLSAFHRNKNQPDGHLNHCKECIRKRNALKKEDKKQSTSTTLSPKLHKIYASEELAKFSPRQLIDELKARGYRGTLTFQQQIIL